MDDIKTATLLKQVSVDDPINHIAGVYVVTPPIQGNKFIFCSAVRGRGTTETYIFPSDGETVSDWGEIEGSQPGVFSHRKVFESLGYEIIEPLC
jgi:hypothetical protein